MSAAPQHNEYGNIRERCLWCGLWFKVLELTAHADECRKREHVKATD